MVGATFAVTMSETTSKSNLTILVVEATSTSTKDSTESNFDSRSTALSFGSKEILGESSIWLDLCKNAEAIRSINVSDKGRLGTTTISSEEQNVEALGFVIENKDLGLTLQNRLTASPKIHFLVSANILGVTPKASGMSLRVGSGESDWIVTSSLLVLADGGRSSVCRDLGISNINHAYNQHAIVSNVAFEKAHEGVAFERFTDTGPLAVLPLRKFKTENRCSVVWSVNPDESDEILDLEEAELRKRLQNSFGYRLGEITRIGRLGCFPLNQSLAREQIRPGLVLLGNVAHTLHPVAGQGMNLALRDMQSLIASIERGFKDGMDCGDMRVLQRYMERQSDDQYQVITFTDKLVSLFSSNAPSEVLVRKFGLLSLELFPLLRKTLAKKAMGLG